MVPPWETGSFFKNNFWVFRGKIIFKNILSILI